MNIRSMGAVVGMAAAFVMLASGCGRESPRALGTLEYDRITLPAVASERLVRVAVREGERVHKGQVLLQLDPTQTQAALDADEARIRQQQALLEQLVAGPRKEDIAQARANLKAAQAQAQQARDYYRRVQPLGGSDYVSASDVDNARAAMDRATAQVAAARAALDVLLHGTRPEQIAQTRATLAATRQQARAQQVYLDKLRIVAPRDGIVDSLPYRLGDQPPVGAPLAVMLVGKAPYARIYVPEPLRASVHDGDPVQVYVDGRDKPLAGHVRTIRREPVYTPYYALNGEDTARLSYLAEVTLGSDAAKLPAGLPVRVTLPEAKR
ncbi:HlyD family efflux transporter periplasmic adaptor subunit [Oleiagrimonas sp. MCCC 1A03011]|uniref:HlyD family secretion protein n=1 Tax=Oleiagrimonas sp. MCCC 1A03011 TaxID=1926883 RepID=UPI000DC3B970|nr:HlyD family efflux transporter periplasmic adaptor subunit [Oleiagrimonas sp. MCCC 1A03011]RAP56287.1 hemolysin secretion protein D [Oleiagrimonas sp. MCCC 1A03011]